MREGKPLDETTRSKMESLLGHDLKEVRVHDSLQAGKLARQLGGEAFTLGSHIFGPSEKLSAGTIQDTGLLAHEITHVLQQTKPQDLDLGTSLERPLAPTPKRRQRHHSPDGHEMSSRTLESGEIRFSSAQSIHKGVVQRQEEELAAQRAEQQTIEAIQAGGTEESNEATLEASPEVIANMVYKMMQQDLMLERERGC